MVNLSKHPSNGFTIIELLIVVAIIGILASIAYPNYQKHIIKTKRTDMMTGLQNIATKIESQKLARGSYGQVTVSDLVGNYPKSGIPLYTVSVTPNPLTADWKVTAIPIADKDMKNDGSLSLDSSGVKCRDSRCGDDWNK